MASETTFIGIDISYIKDVKRKYYFEVKSTKMQLDR
jgi:hypothetical protein